MKKNILILIAPLVVFSISFISCKKTLDLTPTNGVTVDVAYSTPEGYKSGFAKLYGAFALTGNQGPAGQPDISTQTIDEGNSDFVRMFWNVQELSTDEAIDNASWNGNTDAGLHDFHNMNWAAGNPMLKGLYIRSAYQILLCNEFIRQCSDENLSKRGISGKSGDTIKTYIPEARFLRAFQYWVLMDCFGNPAFATEADAIGSTTLPRQIKRAELFDYIESELIAISTLLPAPRANEYGRADQAAAWALLARMYLNAEVYTGTPRYGDAIDYSKKVIDAGYSLETTYNWLFLNDNYKCTNEFIFTINYDGQNSQNFGGTNYIVWAGSASDVGLNTIGVTGWGGNRTTKNLPDLFPDNTGTVDKRSNFFVTGRSKEIVNRVSDGFAVTKFKNINRDGSLGYQLKDLGVGIDLPLFRLAEQYLIYAEAVTRGGAGGTQALALEYFNKLRERAYGNTSGNVSALTPALIIDERARELYWEGFRRTDLIRFNRFVEPTYVWPWKANLPGGGGVAPHYKLFPIPSPELSSNNNLVQNPGY